jgi:hypothetical protein
MNSCPRLAFVQIPYKNGSFPSFPPESPRASCAIIRAMKDHGRPLLTREYEDGTFPVDGNSAKRLARAN